MSMTASKLSWDESMARHLLRRAAFSATDAEIQMFADLGAEETVNRILHPPHASLPPKPEGWEETSFMESMQEMRSSPDRMDQRKAMLDLNREMMFSLRGWWLERMLKGRPSVAENLVLFWHGHFATSFQKVRQPLLIQRQNETFRAHALGPIPDLARAVAEDPAMLLYLDVHQSRASAPNENFARELFELFLLGEGNYTETDIREAARAFTGYRVDERNGTVARRPRRADHEDKTVFGKTGNWSGPDIVTLACDQPACARWLAGKLWFYFAGVPASEALLNRLATRLRELNFSTGDWLREVFLCREFYLPEVRGRQIKGPVHWLIGTCVELQIPLPPPRVIEQMLNQQGQMLFAPPNVRGWEGGRTWINNATLSARYSGSKILLRHSNRRQADKTRAGSPTLKNLPPAPAGETWDKLSHLLLVHPLPEERKNKALQDIDSPEGPLSEAQVTQLAISIMTTPEYQLT